MCVCYLEVCYFLWLSFFNYSNSISFLLSCLQMVITPGDHYLLTASEDGSILIWMITDHLGRKLCTEKEISYTEDIFCTKTCLRTKVNNQWSIYCLKVTKWWLTPTQWLALLPHNSRVPTASDASATDPYLKINFASLSIQRDDLACGIPITWHRRWIDSPNYGKKWTSPQGPEVWEWGESVVDFNWESGMWRHASLRLLRRADCTLLFDHFHFSERTGLCGRVTKEGRAAASMLRLPSPSGITIVVTGGATADVDCIALASHLWPQKGLLTQEGLGGPAGRYCESSIEKSVDPLPPPSFASRMPVWQLGTTSEPT